jgi:acetoin utilization protein AcuB
MTITSIMTRDVVTVGPDTALVDIRHYLHEKNYFHVLVVEEGGALVGIISDRDMLQALGPFLDTYSDEHWDPETLAQPASSVMRADPPTVDANASIEEAAHILLDSYGAALPVTEQGEVVGLLTTEDLLEYFTNGS